MAGDQDGSSGISNSLQSSWQNLRNAATKDNIGRVSNEVKTGLAATMDAAANRLKGETPPPAPAAVTPPPQVSASGSAQTETPPAQPPAPAASAAGTAAPASEAKPEGEKPAEEADAGFLGPLIFKLMPQGVKDWGATMAIPMITQGQLMLSKAKSKPKIIDGPLAWIECLQGGEEVKAIPKSIKGYALTLLDTLGLGKNEEMATALCVGFINFIKTQIGRIFPSFGIKGFNSAANTPAPSMMQMLGFATNPQTFAGIFNMVGDGNRQVDDRLFNVFKREFSKKESIDNIDQYFSDASGAPLQHITYAQFVEAYAKLGSKLMKDNKWPSTLPGMSDEDQQKLMESATGILEKYGIADADGALAQGLAVGCLHGADLVKALKGPAPSDTPAPAAVTPPAAAKPPGTP